MIKPASCRAYLQRIFSVSFTLSKKRLTLVLIFFIYQQVAVAAPIPIDKTKKSYFKKASLRISQFVNQKKLNHPSNPTAALLLVSTGDKKPVRLAKKPQGKIALKKYVRSSGTSQKQKIDAQDASHALFVRPGTDIIYRIEINNTSQQWPLKNLVVEDHIPNCQLPRIPQGGDSNHDGRLDLDETWIYECIQENIQGDIYNVATVHAEPVYDNSRDIQEQQFITAKDPAYVKVIFGQGAISLKEYVRLENQPFFEKKDADSQFNALLVQPNSNIVHRFEISNIGNMTLTNVKLTHYLPNCALTLVNNNQMQDNRLEINETRIYECLQAIVNEYYYHPSIVTANPVNYRGKPLLDQWLLSQDSSHVRLFKKQAQLELDSSIQTTRTTSSESQHHPQKHIVLSAGDSIHYQLALRNTGNTALSDIHFNDATQHCQRLNKNEFQEQPSRPFDRQANKLLKIGETWVYQCQEKNIRTTTTKHFEVIANPVYDDGTINSQSPIQTSDSFRVFVTPQEISYHQC